MKKKTKYEKPTVVPLADTAGGTGCAAGELASPGQDAAETATPCKVGNTTEHCFMGDAAFRNCSSGTTKL